MSPFSFRSRTVAGKSLEMIDTADIQPNPNQPRRIFDEYELSSLAESIRASGLLQPITVRRLRAGYQIISGERRLRASRMAGLRQIPCIVQDSDDSESALLALVENLQRSDLSLFEEAEAIAALIRNYGLNQQEAARRLGIAQSTLSNKLRLLALTADQRSRITAAGLTERHARALLRIDCANQRDRALDKIIAEQMNVSAADQYVNELLTPHENVTAMPRRVAVVGDVRLFLNSLSKMVDHMRMSGVDAKTNKSETEEYIEYTVRIPKRRGTA